MQKETEAKITNRVADISSHMELHCYRRMSSTCLRELETRICPPGEHSHTCASLMGILVVRWLILKAQPAHQVRLKLLQNRSHDVMMDLLGRVLAVKLKISPYRYRIELVWRESTCETFLSISWSVISCGALQLLNLGSGFIEQNLHCNRLHSRIKMVWPCKL